MSLIKRTIDRQLKLIRKGDHLQELIIPATTKPVFNDLLAALNSDAEFGE